MVGSFIGGIMKIIFGNFLNGTHTFPCWYRGEMVTIEFDSGYKAIISANGDIKAKYYKNGKVLIDFDDYKTPGEFYNSVKEYINSDIDLLNAKKNNQIIFSSNNRWECCLYDIDGTCIDDCWVIDNDSLYDVISVVKDSAESIIATIIEESLFL